MKELWQLLKQTYLEWDRHNAPKLGAGLAYYTVLSIAPLLIVVIGVIGLAFGHKAATGQIMDQIQGLVGQEGAKAIQTVIANADKPKTGTLATILGLITLFLGASGVFIELRDSLNSIWDVKAKDSGGVWATIRDRVFSFGMVLAIGFLLLVSLALSAGTEAAMKYVNGILPLPGWTLEVLNIVFSLVVITVLFALIYRFVPDDKVAWRDVWVGAGVTAILFTLGKFLIGLYLGKASIGSTYGAAGSLVVVLAWIYYSAQIFFFGAEFTHVYAIRKGSHQPKATTEGAAVVTVPVHQSTPPEMLHPDVAPAQPSSVVPTSSAAVANTDLEAPKPSRSSRKPAPVTSKAVLIAYAAAIGGLGWWRARSAARRK